MTDIRVGEREIYEIDGRRRIRRWRERGSTPNDVALDMIRARLRESESRSLDRWRTAWFYASAVAAAVGLVMLTLMVTGEW